MLKTMPASLPGVMLLEPETFADSRGYLRESYSRRRYLEQAGINAQFVQDNVSVSHKHVLRGLHFQRKNPQGKLIQVLEGEIFDVLADIDPASASYGMVASFRLSSDKGQQLWIPPGYAHGFCVISDRAIVHYKCTRYHDPHDQHGVAWNCPDLAIDWPLSKPILSHRDSMLPGLHEL